MIHENCTPWDARFFVLCDFVGSWSEDQSRKVGSVIVGPGNEVCATGYNGLPRGISGAIRERHSRTEGQKYFWFEHAERNAIYNMVRTGSKADGCRMYINHFPCADCTRAIIQIGVTDVRTFPFEADDEKFQQHYNVSQQMFEEANISLRLYLREDPALKPVFDNFVSLQHTRRGDK